MVGELQKKIKIIRDPSGIFNLPSLITQIDLMNKFSLNAGTYLTWQLESQTEQC